MCKSFKVRHFPTKMLKKSISVKYMIEIISKMIMLFQLNLSFKKAKKSQNFDLKMQYNLEALI